MVNKGLKGFKKYITQSLTINFLAFYEWSELPLLYLYSAMYIKEYSISSISAGGSL